jgi:hypothetical protein
MIKQQQNNVEGKIIVRGIMTYTLDKQRSETYGTPCRITTKETLLTAEELKKRIGNPKDEIHNSGVCVLYAFHGKVNGKPMSFDTERGATLRTLGYSVASIHNDALYITFKLRDDLESSSPFISSYEDADSEVLPDLVGAIRASKLEFGNEINVRAFKEKDMKFFSMPYMKKVYPEPGVFAKSGHLYVPEGGLSVGKRVKRKKGRPANPDKAEPLKTKPLQDMITEWDLNKSEHLSGFRVADRKPRVTIFEKIDEEGYLSRVKIVFNRFRVYIAYLGTDEEGNTIWVNHKDWSADKESDSQMIIREVKTELADLLAAF